MQAGHVDKAQKYTDKAILQIEKLRSKTRIVIVIKITIIILIIIINIIMIIRAMLTFIGLNLMLF